MQLQIDVINHQKNKMVFQNREDNFEEVYFLNGNIYPLSTLEKKIYIFQLLGLKTTWKTLEKAHIPSLTLYVCVCVNAHVYLCTYKWT